MLEASLTITLTLRRPDRTAGRISKCEVKTIWWADPIPRWLFTARSDVDLQTMHAKAVVKRGLGDVFFGVPSEMGSWETRAKGGSYAGGRGLSSMSGCSF